MLEALNLQKICVQNKDSTVFATSPSGKVEQNSDKLISLNEAPSEGCLQSIGGFFLNIFYTIFQFLKNLVCCTWCREKTETNTSNKEVNKEVTPMPEVLVKKYCSEAGIRTPEEIQKKMILNIQTKHEFSFFGISTEKETDEIFAWLGENFPNLQQLIAFDSNFSQKGIATLAAKCPKLKIIDFKESNINDEMLETLVVSCHQIQELDLSKTFITNKSLKSIASHCKYLTNIYLFYTQINDEGVVPFVQFYKAKLRICKLGGTDTGDQAIKQIALCPNLCSTGFGNNVTDEGAKLLMNHKKLQAVGITTNITFNCIRDLVLNVKTIETIIVPSPLVSDMRRIIGEAKNQNREIKILISLARN